MGSTSVTWRDLTVTSGGNPYRISKIEGWESRPSTRYDKTARVNGHGSHSSAVYTDERLVTVTGTAYSVGARDDLLSGLMDSLTFGDGEESLTITNAGRTLTAGAQLLSADPVIATGSWNVGLISWVAQWRCPDPLRYGTWQSTATKLPTSGGGLPYPLVYPLDYGTLGDLGQMVLRNGGTAEAPVVFTVTGPLPQGFQITAGAKAITYPVEVPAGQVLTIDTAAGTVLLEGTASRRSYLTSADWITIPAKQSITVQFTSLGGLYDAAAQLSASSREAYW